jgi:drug/metabolite transporter (DMT)-like permease
MVVERRHLHHAETAGYSSSSKPKTRTPLSPTTGSKIPRLRRKGSTMGGTLTLSIWSSRALLMFVAAMYSTNFASVKYLETVCLDPPCNHDPSEAAFCRFFISACVCLPILYSNRQHLPIIKAGLECGLWMAVNYICQAEALEYIPAGKCAFISSLAVVTVPLFAGFFLGKPIRPMSLASAMIALVGVGILENVVPIGSVGSATAAASLAATTGTGTTATATILGFGKGDIVALGQPLGFGYGVMRIEHYIEKFSHVPNRVLTMTAAQCVAACLLTFLWVLYDGAGQVPDLTYMLEPHHIIALAWTGIVTTVGATILQGLALQTASATDASLIFSTEPVWGSLFAGWLLKERLTTTDSRHGGGGGSSTQATKRPWLKHKSSSIADESLLPIRFDPQNSSSSEMRTEISISSLTDVQHFPTSMNQGSPVPSMIDQHSSGKMHDFL